MDIYVKEFNEKTGEWEQVRWEWQVASQDTDAAKAAIDLKLVSAFLLKLVQAQ